MIDETGESMEPMEEVPLKAVHDLPDRPAPNMARCADIGSQFPDGYAHSRQHQTQSERTRRNACRLHRANKMTDTASRQTIRISTFSEFSLPH